MVTIATQSFSFASQGLETWLEGLEEQAAADVSFSIDVSRQFIMRFISISFFFQNRTRKICMNLSVTSLLSHLLKKKKD